MKKRIAKILVCTMVLMISMTGCTKSNEGEKKDEGTEKDIKIVATLFPQYDFAREIAGEKAEVEMLMDPGVESHTYEPTPADIIEIGNSDLFIYTGENMEPWANTIIESIDNKDVKVLDVSKGITLEKDGHHQDEHEEEHKEHEEHNHELDPHIWTSPINAMKMVSNIVESLSEIDPDNSDYYKSNGDAYLEKLTNLDNSFRDLMKSAKRNKIIIGDRFAMNYFTEEYGIEWEAAFDSCAANSEPSVKVIKDLIEDIKEENIPVVYYCELSNMKVAKSLQAETGVDILELHSCHTVTKEDFQSGITYIDIMTRNLENLKAGVN